MTLQKTNSEYWFNKAKNIIPGGVNSPVRAFKAVGGNPIFVKYAKGAYLYDEDGNSYIDMIGSWGPMLLGHAHPVIEEAIVKAVAQSVSFGAPTAMEVHMAELIIQMVPSIDMVRMVNSGTEACMSAIRVARGYTGKNKIVKFEGCYHGHGDSFLVAAGSGAATLGEPDSAGVTQGVANDTLTIPYNDIIAVEKIFSANAHSIAAVIIEPVVGNMGCVPPQEGYLEALRKLCTQYGVLLIFDEVMTGFRLARGGAQEYYGVTPDLTTLGKIIGGGMPVGAYGGKKEIMMCVAPAGKVYQAGTLSGNPVAMAAGFAMLSYINDNKNIYEQLSAVTTHIVNGLQQQISKYKLPCTINSVGSMYSLFFSPHRVVNFETAKTADLQLFSAYFNAMLTQGVYLAPSQFESLFVSTAIDIKLANEILAKSEVALGQI
ncbi:MAG: glutamate-1-semialdehyde 2,1-aminomutase [Cytophagales bacterium]|nr:glutamate-1-semialdehyde 2,1-aminomutase [Cytophagales bacterium]